MKCAIVQSNYIPWKGYFDLIRRVDRFILYDDAQYTRRDWRNRNRIKTPQGLQWLTIPVHSKGNYTTPIKDIRISDPDWGLRHWEAIRHNYARAPHFEFARLFEPLFRTAETSLSAVNRMFIERVCEVLGIETSITSSMDYELCDGKNERLIALCKAVGCDSYLSGPSARGYLDVQQFNREGISVEFMDYSYAEYAQLYPPFEHGVTVLDLIFNQGPRAIDHIRSERIC